MIDVPLFAWRTMSAFVPIKKLNPPRPLATAGSMLDVEVVGSMTFYVLLVAGLTIAAD